MYSVQATVKSEVRSSSDVVKQGSKDSITAEKRETVVKLAVKCDNRKRYVMVFGLEETSNEELGRKVDDLFGAMCAMDKPTVSD